MYKTICNYLLYKIFYPLRKRPRRPSRAFPFPPERRKPRRFLVRRAPGRPHARPLRIFSFLKKEASFCPMPTKRDRPVPRPAGRPSGAHHPTHRKGMIMRFHSFDDVQDHLDALGLFHMDFGLDRMRNALDTLGLLTPPFVTVQIVGTNGKGSTSTFLSCVARAHGLKVGLYTSPHFVTPRERIRINGTMLPADRWPCWPTVSWKRHPT